VTTICQHPYAIPVLRIADYDPKGSDHEEYRKVWKLKHDCKNHVLQQHNLFRCSMTEAPATA
jgi:hypothetical protein